MSHYVVTVPVPIHEAERDRIRRGVQRWMREGGVIVLSDGAKLQQVEGPLPWWKDLPPDVCPASASWGVEVIHAR